MSVSRRPARLAAVDIAAQWEREFDSMGDKMMANISEDSIITYPRKPGYLRAAIIPKVRLEVVVGGDKVRSVVTPDDYASESEAELAAQKLIRKLA